MMLNWSDLRSLFALTLTRPRDAARAVIGLGWPLQAVWLAAGAVATLGALVSSAARLAMPPDPEIADILNQVSPVTFAMFAFAALALSSFVFTQSGRVLGGKGRFKDVLAVMVWLQTVLLGFEVLLFALMLLVPALGAVVTLIAYAAGLVWMVLFLQVAHRFDRTGRAVGALLLGIVLIGFLLQFVLLAGGPL